MRVLPVDRRVIILLAAAARARRHLDEELHERQSRYLRAGGAASGCPEPYDTNRPPVHRRADAPAADRVRPQRGHLCGACCGWRRASWAPAAGPGSISILFVCFALGTPWTVLGFWNALIGLWLLHFRKDAVAEVAPYAAAGDQPTPLRIKTAIFMTVRNEDPGRAILRLQDRQGQRRRHRRGRRLQLLRAERHQRSGRRRRRGDAPSRPGRPPIPDRDRIVYRRRTDNTGFKAGNVRDFCARWGKDFALMLPLDADSLMSGARDRAPGAHDAGPSQDRHPAEPGRRHAVGQRVRAHLPVRHAPRHALLHHGPGLVGRRLRPVLGPQRAGAHQAVPRAVRPADAARQAAARRPRARRTTRSRPP